MHSRGPILLLAMAMVSTAMLGAQTTRVPAPTAKQAREAALAAERQVAQDSARAAAITLARQLAAEGDTATAVEYLRDAAASAPQDPYVWHEYGMLLSAWSKAYWRRGIMPSGIPQRIIVAETSLARAMRLAPDSASYAIHYGQQLWGSNFTSMSSATRAQETAMLRAIRIGDSASIALSGDALGLFLWRRYEPLINRRVDVGALGYTDQDFVLEPYKFRVYIENGTKLVSPPLGEALYEESLAHFRRAREYLLDDELPFRHEAMALAARDRWEELASIARTRVAQRPAQMWPWLALGIAQQRLKNFAAASIALDSGYARMPDTARVRLLNAKQLLATPRAKFFDTLSVERRAQLAGVYWSAASPTMLVVGNPVYDEFRARVAFAEMMWTNEEMRLRGAESDRGEVFIRWGPPDLISTHPGAPLSRLSWMYRSLGLTFFFGQAPLFGTANLEEYYRTYVLEPNEWKRPASWANLPLMRRGVDSIPVQIARFRGVRDSVDVALFAGVPTGALRVGLPTDSSVIKTGVFVLDAAGRVQMRQLDPLRSGQRDSTALESRQWRMRVPTSAAYMRVDALEEDAMHVARVIRDVAGFSTTGFGVSDMVIGTQIAAPQAQNTARWTNFTIGPIAGNAIRTGKPLDLLWEVYEPTVRDERVSYRVAITVQREARGGLTGVVARLSGSLRDAVVRNRGSERVGVEYDRTAPASSVFAESLRLNLGSSRAGRYRLTLTVTDLYSGLVTSREREIVLVDR